MGNALPGLSVRFATLTIATLPAWIESGISRHSSSTPDHFRLNFGCALTFLVLSLIVVVSRLYGLEARESALRPPLPNDRRRTERLQSVPNQAVLEWRDGSQTRSSRGNILNISDHGALISSDSFPQLGENVLIRLKRPVQTDWTGSIVVRHVSHNELAVDFGVGCPYDLGLAATQGIDIISSVLGLPDSDRFSNSGD